MSPKPSYPPSLADWEDHRPIIRSLYVNDDRNLSEVQQILCQKHHFKASLRSYKKKLRAWGFQFASPSPLSCHISPSSVKEDEDNATTWPPQGLSPQPHLSSQASEASDENKSQISTPQHTSQALIKRQSNSRSPTPNFMIVEDISAVTQSIVLAAKTSITATSEAAYSDNSEVFVKQTHHPFRRRKNYIWHQLHHSLTLLEQGSILRAFETLQRGCSMAEGYFLRPSRQVVMSLLIVLGNRRWSRHQQAWLSIVRFLASMASKVLGPRHPLSHITNNLRSWDLMRDIALPTMRVIVDTYSEQLGQAHPEVLMLKQSLSVELMRNGDLDRSEAIIQEACATSGRIHGQSSQARRNCLRRLGNLYFEQKRWKDAESIFENIVALDSEANQHGGPIDQTSVFTCQNLSLLNHQRGDRLKSEYWARQELDLALKIYGPDDEYYKDCLVRQSARLRDEAPEKWFSWFEVS
ncbi:hypothetical protein H2200_006946 [Cladophialophora chaetospira]|uniref:Clr5 domain-containing protein n=1 Tax=Cladophialophora chaetospira TaxID=386627 RepID=A0AA38X9R3_9EURO|nr:hypothetical protein H2200_006946 [Cladophialophora chaetospira]